MEQVKKYDVVFIGGGPGGYVGAIKSARLGLKTAIVEKRRTMGGTCLNVGCIPAKALLDATEMFFRARTQFPDMGIKTGSLEMDLAVLMKKKESIVTQLTGGVDFLLKKNGVAIFRGNGEILSPGKVKISGNEEQTIEADHIVIATGSMPVELPFIPFDGDRIIDSTRALSLESVPDSLLVIGAGAIGLEMGSLWSRLGAGVTIVELADQIIPGADRQGANTLMRILQKQGLAISLSTKITGLQKEKDSVRLEGKDSKGNPVSFKGEKVLVAVGRKPNTEGLNLEKIGIFPDSRGRIEVDSGYKTAIPGIYAIGDVIKGPMLAHKAEEEGAVVSERIAGKWGEVNYGVIPGIVYTWPEYAGVGASEEDLIREKREYKKGIFHFKANGRALTRGEPEGFVKILADSRYDTILGAQIVGAGASDLIHSIGTVMEFRGSSEDLARMTFGHPTLSEAIKEAAMDVLSMGIHKL